MNKKNILHKAVLLSTLAFTQCIGTVALVQNSIVQTYAEEKNKDVYLIADFYDVGDNLCSTVEFTKNFNVSLNKKYTIRSLINPETPTVRIKRKYRQEKAERGK